MCGATPLSGAGAQYTPGETDQPPSAADFLPSHLLASRLGGAGGAQPAQTNQQKQPAAPQPQAGAAGAQKAKPKKVLTQRALSYKPRETNECCTHTHIHTHAHTPHCHCVYEKDQSIQLNVKPESEDKQLTARFQGQTRSQFECICECGLVY